MEFDELAEVHEGHSCKKGVFRTRRGTYVKAWRRRDAEEYFDEKWCYELLADCPYVPALVRADDARLQLEVEDAGPSLRVLAEDPTFAASVPDWREQIREIICELAARGIRHNDLNGSNLACREGLIRALDFGAASYPGRAKKLRREVWPAQAHTLQQYLAEARVLVA